MGRSFLRFLGSIRRLWGSRRGCRHGAFGRLVRQAHVGLKRLVCGFYHADDHLEVVFALDFVQFDIFVLQPVLDSLLEIAREGNVHFFQPSIRGYVVFQSRHRSPLDYLQG